MPAAIEALAGQIVIITGFGPSEAIAAPDLVTLQTRGVGVTTALREDLPAWVAALFAALTRLGDTVTLVVLATLVYVVHDRRSGAFVIGVLLTGFGVVLALKAALALPRPPTELHLVAAHGYGFPSGHALGATVGWGATALALEGVWTRRGRLLVAGAVAGVVSLSRLAIGVHYLVDVIAGVVLGIVVLAMATRWTREEPLRALVTASVVALVAVAATGVGHDAALLLGSTFGGMVAWQVVEPTGRPWGRQGVYASAGGVGLALTGLAIATPSASLAFGVGALVSGAVFLTPVVVGRWLR